MKLFLEVVDRAWPVSAPNPSLPSKNEPLWMAFADSVVLSAAMASVTSADALMSTLENMVMVCVRERIQIR